MLETQLPMPPSFAYKAPFSSFNSSQSSQTTFIIIKQQHHKIMKIFSTILFVFVCVVNILCASSAPAPLCPQHIGPPCPYYYNNTMDDYQPGINSIK